MLNLEMKERFVDRRKYKRVKSSVDVLITVRVGETENEHTLTTGKTVNISGNGLLLTFDGDIPVDTVITLTFFPPHSDELIDVKGKVKRVEQEAEQFKLGIEFVDLKPELEARLDKILNTAESDSDT